VSSSSIGCHCNDLNARTGIGGDGVYAPYPPEMGFEIPGRTGGKYYPLSCVKF